MKSRKELDHLWIQLVGSMNKYEGPEDDSGTEATPDSHEELRDSGGSPRAVAIDMPNDDHEMHENPASFDLMQTPTQIDEIEMELEAFEAKWSLEQAPEDPFCMGAAESTLLAQS